jgi:hypothetical protein
MERSRQPFELQSMRHFSGGGLNFSMMNPKAITAMPVRTQARNVRSLAAWSV